MCDKNIPEFIFTLDEGLDSSFLPKQTTQPDTGWDVQSSNRIIIKPFEKVFIPLGLKCFAPAGYWLELRPRSSTFGKKNLHSLYGVIDESYEGQIYFACQWIPPFEIMEIDKFLNGFDERSRAAALMNYFSKSLTIEKGERIGQLVPVKRQVMNVNSVSADEFKKLCEERGHKRGSGGFGSSGN